MPSTPNQKQLDWFNAYSNNRIDNKGQSAERDKYYNTLSARYGLSKTDLNGMNFSNNKAPSVQPVNQNPNQMQMTPNNFSQPTGSSANGQLNGGNFSQPTGSSQPSFKQYDPTAQIDQQFLDQAGATQFKYGKSDEGYDLYRQANQFMTPEQIREIAFYQQQGQGFLNQAQGSIDGEIKKGYGITDDWTNKNVNPLMKQYYANQDFYNSKFGGASSDNFYGLNGMSRDENGYNHKDASGNWIGDTRDQYSIIQQLMNKGYSYQEATNAARLFKPKDDEQKQLYSSSQYQINPLIQEYLKTMGG